MTWLWISLGVVGSWILAGLLAYGLGCIFANLLYSLAAWWRRRC